MNFPIVLLSAFTSLLGLGVLPAAAEPASCELTVDGKTYIDGLCSFEPLSGDGGSFTITNSTADYFAYVHVNKDGSATAHWNEIAGASRAHTSLGRLTRGGDCWTSDTVHICASKHEEDAELSPLGDWDCEIMGFTLTESTYKNSSAPEAPVAEIKPMGKDAFHVVLEDGYSFGLFEVTKESSTWYSMASGDIFECIRG
jgi:hypothetical protein